jgi:hypothetical protein
MPFLIKIVYNVHIYKDTENYSAWKAQAEDPDFRYASPYIYNLLIFTFDGSEFTGDYDKFYKIIHPE